MAPCRSEQTSDNRMCSSCTNSFLLTGKRRFQEEKGEEGSQISLIRSSRLFMCMGVCVCFLFFSFSKLLLLALFVASSSLVS